MDDRPWFRAKRYGYGSGMPITWQGWLLLAGYIGAIFIVSDLAAVYLPQIPRTLGVLAALVIPSAVALPIMRKKTEGGWRWRGRSDL
jgi:hypothetical protein